MECFLLWKQVCLLFQLLSKVYLLSHQMSKRSLTQNILKHNIKKLTVKQIKLSSRKDLLNKMSFKTDFFLISFSTIPRTCIWEWTEICSKSQYHLRMTQRWLLHLKTGKEYCSLWPVSPSDIKVVKKNRKGCVEKKEKKEKTNKKQDLEIKGLAIENLYA